MILRPAVRGDAGALAATHAAAFDAPWDAETITRFAEDRGGFALAAEDAGNVAGFILCRVIADEAEVLTLAVRPERRRQGVARALVEAAAHVAAPSAEAMFLEVAADNPGAVALYETCAFTAVGRRPGYYGRTGGSVDAIVMRRVLNTGASAAYPGG